MTTPVIKMAHMFIYGKTIKHWIIQPKVPIGGSGWLPFNNKHICALINKYKNS